MVECTMMECKRAASFVGVSAVSHRCTYVAKELFSCVSFAATRTAAQSESYIVRTKCGPDI